jgi:hypothetical protein
MTLRPQLELSIEPAPLVCRSSQRRRRIERARWWFEQMRRAVNEAPDQSAAPQDHRRN